MNWLELSWLDLIWAELSWAERTDWVWVDRNERVSWESDQRAGMWTRWHSQSSFVKFEFYIQKVFSFLPGRTRRTRWGFRLKRCFEQYSSWRAAVNVGKGTSIWWYFTKNEKKLIEISNKKKTQSQVIRLTGPVIHQDKHDAVMRSFKSLGPCNMLSVRYARLAQCLEDIRSWWPKWSLLGWATCEGEVRINQQAKYYQYNFIYNKNYILARYRAERCRHSQLLCLGRWWHEDQGQAGPGPYPERLIEVIYSDYLEYVSSSM